MNKNFKNYFHTHFEGSSPVFINLFHNFVLHKILKKQHHTYRSNSIFIKDKSHLRAVVFRFSVAGLTIGFETTASRVNGFAHTALPAILSETILSSGKLTALIRRTIYGFMASCKADLRPAPFLLKEHALNVNSACFHRFSVNLRACVYSKNKHRAISHKSL